MTQKSVSFRAWLLKQKSRDDPVGDLAMDVAKSGGTRARFKVAIRGQFTSLQLAEHIQRENIYYPLASAIADAVELAFGEYSEAHPASAKRAAYRNVGPTLRFQILSRDKFTCQACGAKAPNVRLEIDHRVAFANGGTDEGANLWTLCFDCNRGKGAM